jgi:hypothetical protein
MEVPFPKSEYHFFVIPAQACPELAEWAGIQRTGEKNKVRCLIDKL